MKEGTAAAPSFTSPPMPSASDPEDPAPLLAQPQCGRDEIEQCRHQCCHRQRLNDLLTHLLPSIGRARLRTTSDATPVLTKLERAAPASPA